MRTIAIFFLISLFLAAGCGGGQSVGTGDGIGSQDSTPIWEVKADTRIGHDESSPEEIKPGVDLETPEIVPDSVAPDTIIEEGGFGWPCQSHEECDAFCIATPDGPKCTKTCVADCPDGWKCVPAPDMSDPIYICMPRFLKLCNPCNSNLDCSLDDMTVAGNDLCLARENGGSFCAAYCDEENPCPQGYNCDEVKLGNLNFTQCMPEAGECECSKMAIQEGLSTACKVKNDFGTCQGDMVCDPGGLSPCDAAPAQQEICDDQDNDCDGFVDEGCDDDNDGFCDWNMLVMGEPAVCGNSQPDCDDGEPKTYPGATELCDAKDNNCDGSIDEGLCDDGDPCTDNLCDPLDGSCTYPFNEAPCSDNNECTQNDHCVEGACVGAEKSCDDNNPCTDNLCNPFLEGGCNWPNNSNPCIDDGNQCTDDVCDSGTCQHKPLSNFPCDDGDPCTVGDNCNSGHCLGGQTQKDCDDDDQCTADTCTAGVGCKHTDLFDSPCVYTYTVLIFECDLAGYCGSNGCVPEANCNIANCNLCIQCSGMSFCLDGLFQP